MNLIILFDKFICRIIYFSIYFYIKCNEIMTLFYVTYFYMFVLFTNYYIFFLFKMLYFYLRFFLCEAG